MTLTLPDRHLGLIVDVETTGLSDRDEIVELALLLFSFDADSGEPIALVDKYTGIQEPTTPCSEEAAQLHGLTAEVTRGKHLDRSIALGMLERTNLVFAHNAEFDRKFLCKAFTEAASKIWICTMRDILWDLEGLQSKSLESITTFYGIERPVAHRAFPDAMAVFEVLHKRNSAGITHLKQLHERVNRPELQISIVDATGESLSIVIAHKDEERLLRCVEPIVAKLWTAPGYDGINAYLKGSVGGTGRVLTFDKANSRRLRELIEGEFEVELRSISKTSTCITFALNTRLIEKYSQELLFRLQELRARNLNLLAEARSLEKTNLPEAVTIYRQALARVGEYAEIQPLLGLAGELKTKERQEHGIEGHLEILDRLTLGLCRQSCGEEAFSIAADYFRRFQADRSKPLAAKILKRVAKYE